LTRILGFTEFVAKEFTRRSRVVDLFDTQDPAFDVGDADVAVEFVP